MKGVLWLSGLERVCTQRNRGPALWAALREEEEKEEGAFGGWWESEQSLSG